MLSEISWQAYMVTLLVATSLYYLFIWVFFYKAKLSVLRGISNIRQLHLHTGEEPDEMMNAAQYVMDELRPLFIGRTNKNELIGVLQGQLKKYNQWNEPAFRDTINDFIFFESQSKCSISLSEEDQRVLWQ